MSMLMSKKKGEWEKEEDANDVGWVEEEGEKMDIVQEERVPEK